jgi:hypothetical protein
MSRVVWWTDVWPQKYLEPWAENHPKYPELVWMEKHLKRPKRPKHLGQVRMENRPKRPRQGFP